MIIVPDKSVKNYFLIHLLTYLSLKTCIYVPSNSVRCRLDLFSRRNDQAQSAQQQQQQQQQQLLLPQISIF